MKITHFRARFLLFIRVSKSELVPLGTPLYATRRDSGSNISRSQRKTGFLRTKPTPTERASKELQDGVFLCALQCSVLEERQMTQRRS